MCGIIGYVGANAEDRTVRILAGREKMIDRGPDDAGIWIGPHACLASRRLAVLDLSPAGHMPMTSADGRFIVVFNGAIYNFVELRSELARSVAFRSTGDTEVIVNGMQVWGWKVLLERLDGMFAIAIWDARERRLFAARDRLGEKPFFHTRFTDGFAFASTLPAVATLRAESPRIDMHALDAYLTHHAVPSPMALLHGYAQLPPAHALQFDVDRNALTIDRYWDVAYTPKRWQSERDAVDAVDTLLRKSVRERLRSDVPTGTLLSGGVDSSLITALATEEGGAPVDAVTMGLAAPEDDERPFARMVAKRYGARLHEEVLAENVVQALPAIVARYGQPVADVSIVPNYFLASVARRVMTVALVGDGADEVFGGYARPMIERVAPTYRRMLPLGLRRALCHAWGEQPGMRSATSLRRNLGLLARAGQGSARDAFVHDRGFRQLHSMYSGSFRDSLAGWNSDSAYNAMWDRAVGSDDVDCALYGDLTTYLPDQLLAKQDVSSMAFGLETRSPFLARSLVEYAATLPTSMRLRHFQTKYLLKKVAERYVPREAIYRRKRGFVIPAARWLRGPLAQHVSAILNAPSFLDRGWFHPDAVQRLLREHLDGSHDWSDQIWTVLVLELWMRLTIDRTLAPDESLDAVLSRDGAR